VEAYDSGIVLTPTYPMKLARSAREPDLLFISKERLYLSKDNYMDGPADLVVEIVSPESRKRDRVQKLKEYEEGGVREYWLLDPIRKEARFYQLAASAYVEATVEDGVYRSVAMPGLWIRVEWLWQDPHPKIVSVLKEWKLI
jgi:Uma2 family endonuclease